MAAASSNQLRAASYCLRVNARRALATKRVPRSCGQRLEVGVVRVQAAQGRPVVLGTVVGRLNQAILLQALLGGLQQLPPCIGVGAGACGGERGLQICDVGRRGDAGRGLEPARGRREIAAVDGAMRRGQQTLRERMLGLVARARYAGPTRKASCT